jgi:hypothetical protein
MTIEVTRIPQLHPNLGRHRVHDSRSKAFAAQMLIDRTKWVTKTLRIYDPRINPNQCHGECTGCAKAMQFNAVGNRIKGVVLTMTDAHKIYHLGTTLDPFEGEWPPEDTGSSGLASAKAAKKLGLGGEYRHVFNGADGVVQLIQDGQVVSIGTLWYEGMFTPNDQGVIEPTGSLAGGHQYVAHGYNVEKDLVIIRCWWGSYKDVKIKREHLNQLLLDDGDAHVQDRLISVSTRSGVRSLWYRFLDWWQRRVNG